ncbi:hypothetical protein [Vibrio methylphosphonaticus]|uniref:hypothetical protein n=1 Tax=Vibrio methylphosphonaticus TaxID=2946866 RepID=UPI00202A9010|nr:hypothetical protein [Vibrio methylphosphonaticus]MCL9776288.1 hypothetical protein [Vibrio methylphosphonaticus]
MKDAAMALYNKKNEWLASQVDVEFPTPESIKGRALYLDSLTSRYLEPVPVTEGYSATIEWHLVDFHRLTVMFSLLQSKIWESEEAQNVIVEFLTQIILEPEYSLYVGFTEGEAVCAASVCRQSDVVVVSDIVDATATMSHDDIALSLIYQTLNINNDANTNLVEIWIEKR